MPKNTPKKEPSTPMKGDFPTEQVVKELNERQKQAVLHQVGPLLILAGAGSGKTKVIAHRIANLIKNGVQPEQILAITFTNKAAAEMRERIIRLLNPKGRPELPFISTFHSLGVFILRESSKSLGISRNFSIFDEEDSLSLIKECLKKLSFDPKQFQPARIQAIISKNKSELEELKEVRAKADRSPFLKAAAAVFEKYEEELGKHRALDFDDLIAKTVSLFSRFPEILKQYQEKWQYIHIDEYQDTNHAQYCLAKLLARTGQNICCVGDVDQAIYQWRGADFRNILNFEKDWPQAAVITLEENYRSTQNILDAANAVISKNQLRKPKNLIGRQGAGEKIKFFAAANELEEADFIARASQNLISQKIPPQKIAVLFRANFQSRVLEEAFSRRQIPYQLIGVRFYQRKEVKDILAYLRAALNPENLFSVKRIINVPGRGIGKTLAAKYLAAASDAAGTITAPKPNFKIKETGLIKNFESILAGIKKQALENSASQAIRACLEISGYRDFLNDSTEEGLARLANIEELASSATKYDGFKPPQGIERLLDDAALMAEQDAIKDRSQSVKLMTVHSAKGLEFDAVFVSGLEDGLFPHFLLSGKDQFQKEEERRLFYVALTRARENLFLSCAFFRTIFGAKQANKPSKFLEDIPKDLLESVNPEEETLESIDIKEL
ncbi:MAG: UvrD-helicase domain-containing protein [Patescibacteria group bacterium]